MRPSSLLAATLLCLTVDAGCAATNRSLHGQTSALPLEVLVDGATSGHTGRATVEFQNRSPDPVGVEISEIRLGDGAGRRHEPLGRTQRFVEGGVRVVRRVAHRPLNIPPGEKRHIVLEFEKLPGEGALTLFVPTLYRLTIEGQADLPPLRIPLTAQAAAGGFHDPFDPQ